MNLAELAEQSAQRLGERKTMIFEGQEYTNLQFLKQARCLHRGLSGLGLGKGDVAVMCLTNHPTVFPTFQGIFRTGAIAIPVMFTLTTPELNYIFSDCQAQGIITDAFSIERVREAVQGLEHIKWIAVLGGSDDPAASVPEHSLETLFESEPEESLPNVDQDDVALMLYTAGTTGKPKGVMLTHRNLIHTAEASLVASEMDERDTPRVSVSALPLAHIFGVGVMNGSFVVPKHLANGYTVQMAWFEPEQFMQLIQEHKATFIAVVPTVLAMLLNHPKVKEYDLTSLEEVVSGAAPLPVEQALAFSELARIDSVREIYGCTECTGLGSANLASEPYLPGSAGKAYMGMELNIFDEDDNPLPQGERGEVVIKGPAVMKGYLNRPEETAKALRNGWLHTGDVGYLDENGYLFIVDRKKDMIIRGGENIYPGELEEIMYQHPAVAEAAVIGTPDPVYGENVVAYVVLRQDQTATDSEIIDFMKTKTSSFKAPSKVNFIEAIPKSPIGKILKRELRDLAAGE
ncbi:MAG: AMP-binding protein [Proteobacteria bacterium]|nr:AMP-binding protein [Pseudomonadota bacterium]